MLTGVVYWKRNSKKEEEPELPKPKTFSLIPRVSAAKPVVDKQDPETGEEPAGAYRLSRSEQFNFIADVVEKTAPAVVNIEIEGRHPLWGQNVTLSNGSGFIVKEDGLILTNAHVVCNKSMVTVKLHDGRIFNGVVEDVDSVSDLATVRIKCTKLPVLKLGSSAKLRAGEWVVAMGSPLALSNTVTAGVISSVNRGSRELGIRNKNIDYIQTDASINFGNSGGPLVNLEGEAIGINTMKVTAGISFAIPSDYAHEFLNAVSEKKPTASGWFGLGGSSQPAHQKRRYMGITMLSLTPSLIMELQQRQPDFPEDVTHGVMVWKVVVGSPAYKGGLMPGDIVTHINSKQVLTARDVNQALDGGEGDLKLTVVRKHQKMTLTVSPEGRH